MKRRALSAATLAAVASMMPMACTGPATSAAAPVAAAPALASSTAPAGTPLTRQAILAAMERMADRQLEVNGDKAPADWVAGAFYVGLARLAHNGGDKRFLDAELRIAERNDWQLKTEASARSIAHADNQAIGQMYVDAAVATHDLSKLKPLCGQLDQVFDLYANAGDNIGKWRGSLVRDTEPMPWWWCDSYFMAPPLYARLSAVTGDKKYVAEMDKLFWQSDAQLWDAGESLYWRDNSFKQKLTPNGKKTFWSRGNGWVMAGIPNILMYLPKDHPTRSKFEERFRALATRIKGLQGDDGLWRVNLLDPAAAPEPETSGTAFYCYGMAWGINNGLLDRATFQPAVMKAWAGLNSHIRPDGLIGYVQKVSDRPLSTEPGATNPYAVGGYLLAGVEVTKLLETKK